MIFGPENAFQETSEVLSKAFETHPKEMLVFVGKHADLKKTIEAFFTVSIYPRPSVFIRVPFLGYD